jgi:hypothetical protein
VLILFIYLLNDEFWVQPIICNLQSDVIFYFVSLSDSSDVWCVARADVWCGNMQGYCFMWI